MEPEKIKLLRDKLGLSQKDFADSLGISFATVNRWENKHTEVPKHIARLLECLSVLVDKASQSDSGLTLDDIRDAVKNTGVVGVVSSAAVAGTLPKKLVLSLAAIPAFAWLAGALGIGVAGALPFFIKLGLTMNKSQKDKLEEE